MPGQVVSDVLAVHIETISKTIGQLYEANQNTGYKRFKRVPTSDASGKDHRIPLATSLPGLYRGTSFDLGPGGRGNGSAFAELRGVPFDRLVAIEWSLAVEDKGRTSTQAAINIVAHDAGKSLALMELMEDKLLFGKGDGILATLSSNPAGGVVNLASPLKARWLTKRQVVKVVSAAVAERGTATLDVVNYKDGTATSSSWPGGTVSTDTLRLDGIAYPGAGTVHGLQFHVDETPTGTYFGLNRATYPELVSQSVNANNGVMTPALFQQAEGLLSEYWGDRAMQGKYVCYIHPRQLSAWANQIQAVMQVDMPSGAGNEALDPVINRKRLKTFGGRSFFETNNIHPTVSYLVNEDRFQKPTSRKVGMISLAGRNKWEVRESGGGVAWGTICYIGVSDELMSDGPGEQVKFYNLAENP